MAWHLFYSTVVTRGMGTKSEVEPIVWMIGLQPAFGLVLLIVAAWQLRPIFRRQDSEGEAGRNGLVPFGGRGVLTS